MKKMKKIGCVALTLILAVSIFLPVFCVNALTDVRDSTFVARTDGWDLSRKAEGIVKTTMGGTQYLRFDKPASDSYVINANISSAQGAGSDWPYAGIVVGDDDNGNGIRFQLFNGWQGNNSEFWFKIFDMNWNQLVGDQKPTGISGMSTADGVGLRIVRSGKTADIFVNGVLVYTYTSELLASPGYAGLVTDGMKATFSNVSYGEQLKLSGIREASDGWDLSQKDNGVVKSAVGGFSYIIFDTPKASEYTVETTISDAYGINDSWPFAGIIVGDDGMGNGVRLQLFNGWQGNNSDFWFKIFDMNWNQLVGDVKVDGLPGMGNSTGVAVRVVRSGKTFDVIINDALAYTYTTDLLINPGRAGLHTNGLGATFSAYSWTSDIKGGLDFATTGWDISDETHGTVKTIDGGMQAAYFSAPASSNYTITADMSSLYGIGDDWPFAGFIVGDDRAGNGIRLQVFNGWQGNNSDFWFKIFDMNWNQLVGDQKPEGLSTIGESGGAELKIVRKGNKFNLYINDNNVYSYQSDLLANPGYAGLVTNGMGASFTDVGFKYDTVDPKAFDPGNSPLVSGWNDFNYHYNNTVLPFKIYIPEGYTAEGNYPALMFLHGLGYIGKTPADILAGGDEGVIVNRAVNEYKNTIVIVPCAQQGWIYFNSDPSDSVYPNKNFSMATDITERDWLHAADALYSDVAEHLAVDEGHLYISGYSRGGQSVLWFLNQYPDRFAGAIICVATGDVSEAKNLAKTPVWLFAGDNDAAMEYDDVIALYNAVKKENGNIRITTGAGCGHSVGGLLNNTNDLISWLYSQPAVSKDAEDVQLPLADGEEVDVKTAIAISGEGWDTSKLSDYVLSTTLGDFRQIVFDTPAASRYLIETTVSSTKSVGDAWPAVGILVGDDLNGNGIRIQLFTGHDGIGSHFLKIYDVNRTEPAIAEIALNEFTGIESVDGAKLSVLRNGKNFRFYINNRLVYEGESDLLTNAGIAGLYTVGNIATFTGSKYTCVKQQGVAEPEKPGLPLENDEKAIVIKKITPNTDGWDTSRQGAGIMTSDKSGFQQFLFDTPLADKYIIETTVSNVNAMNDEWPAAGILVGDDLSGNGIRIQLFTGYNGTGSHFFKIYDVNRTEPAIAEISLNKLTGIESADGARLKVIRIGKSFKFYINDVLAYEGESELLAKPGVAGFYTVGCTAQFSNYSYIGVEASENPHTGDLGFGLVVALSTLLVSVSSCVIYVFLRAKSSHRRHNT